MPEKLQIAVCDDDPIDRQRAAGLTREIIAAEGLTCGLSTYVNAAALRGLGDNTAIIFISSNREMALRGYEVSAARYLAKPLREEQLREALLYCYNTFCEKKEILLPTAKGRRRIPLSDILYAEAMERVAKLALVNRVEELSIKFSDLIPLLPERRFVLCHRSYLVNLEHIAYIRSRELELTTGEALPVSRYRLEDLQKRFVGYLRG